MYLRRKITSLFFMTRIEERNTQNNWYKKVEMPGYRQFLILIGMLCVGFSLALIASIIVIASSRGVHLADLSNAKKIPHSLAIWLLIIQDIFFFALPAFMFAKIVGIQKIYFQFKKSTPATLWLLTAVIAFAALPTSDIFSQINEWIPISKHLRDVFKAAEEQYNNQASLIIDFKSPGNFIVSLLLIAALPAIVEELLFRGALQKVLLKWVGKPFPAILITSIIFSVIHWSYFGFLPRLFLGMILGYVYYYGKNIWLNMFVHFINNAVVLISLYINSKNGIVNLKDMSNDVTPIYVQIMGVIVLIAALYFFAKNAKTQTLKS
jgi:membrane protease YdiL (CAAX protease family)